MNARKRAMTPEHARKVKRKGHEVEKIFADLINGKTIPGQHKTDVIDRNNNRHSIKSGEYWQMFLYSIERIKTGSDFNKIPEIKQLLLDALLVFPEFIEDYQDNKSKFKIDLQKPMRELRSKLSNEDVVVEFYNEGIFKDGVDYLTIYEDELNVFNVFAKEEVANILTSKVSVENSKAKTSDQFDDQKVIFRYNGKNLGELEIRTDSMVHFREIKFRLHGYKILALLVEHITRKESLKDNLKVYGRACEDNII